VLASQSLSVLGRDDEARRLTLEGIRRAERRLELDPSDIRALSLGANALFEAGERDRALAWSARSLELDPTDPSALVNGACLHASAGLKDEALDLLERALAQGWGKRDWVEHDPDYDSLRGDPRFEALVARLS
jgi:adenylate cyclase